MSCSERKTIELSRERARLVEALIEAAKATGSGNLGTPRQVDAFLNDLRRKVTGCSDAPDEAILEMLIVHLTGDHSAAMSPDERTIWDLIRRSKDLCYQKDFNEAAKTLRAVEQLATRAGSEVGLAWAKQYLGRIERDSGNFPEAMALYEHSLAIAERISQRDLIAVLYDQMGTAFRWKGDFVQAQIYYKMALTTDPESESFVKGNLAALYQARGDVERAVHLNEESTTAYQIEGNLRGLAMATLVTALDFLKRHDYKNAGASALEAHRLGIATEYAHAKEEARKIFVLICGDLLRVTDGILHFRKVLALDWLAAEWDIRSELLANAFMCASKRDCPLDAADFAWTLCWLAAESHDSKKAAWIGQQNSARPGPLEKVETLLGTTLQFQSVENNVEKVVATKLALAQCLGARGEYEAALRMAAGAARMLGSNASPEYENKVEKFCREVRSLR